MLNGALETDDSMGQREITKLVCSSTGFPLSLAALCHFASFLIKWNERNWQHQQGTFFNQINEWKGQLYKCLAYTHTHTIQIPRDRYNAKKTVTTEHNKTKQNKSNREKNEEITNVEEGKK